MSDDVYEKNGVAFTRYWGGGGDRVQITIGMNYATLSIEELHEAVKAIDASVEETKDAWWHGIKKD